MGDFKWRHFEGEVILWAVRWYCKYGISYRDLEQMLEERGVSVDHTMLIRLLDMIRRVAVNVQRWNPLNPDTWKQQWAVLMSVS